MDDVIERIKNTKEKLESDLALYLGSSVSRMEMRDLTELYNIIDESLARLSQFFFFCKDRMKTKLGEE